MYFTSNNYPSPLPSSPLPPPQFMKRKRGLTEMNSGRNLSLAFQGTEKSPSGETGRHFPVWKGAVTALGCTIRMGQEGALVKTSQQPVLLISVNILNATVCMTGMHCTSSHPLHLGLGVCSPERNQVGRQPRAPSSDSYRQPHSVQPHISSLQSGNSEAAAPHMQL